MFPFCRLCANCTEVNEIMTEISELESKLSIFCGWKSSQNEMQMPRKVCQSCVNQLQQSWNFVEQILSAEEQLQKLLNEQNERHMDIECEKEFKPNNYQIELEPSSKSEIDAETYDDNDDTYGEPIDYYNDNESCDSPVVEPSIKKESNNKSMKTDPLLAVLGPEDFLDGGEISSNGIVKLEAQFPHMNTISWNDCQYTCDKCNRVIKGSHNLFAHNRSIHPDELLSIKISCFYCNVKHTRECTLQRHISTEHFVHLKFR